MNRLLPELVRDATLLCVFGGKDRPAGHIAVDIHEGILLRYGVCEHASLLLQLLNTRQRMELVAIWPQLADGSRLVAEIVGLIASPEGTQAHAQLVVPDLPDHSGFCVYLSEYACGAGLWALGGKYDFRVTGLPLQVRRADMAPILIGPDAPGYAAMIAAGARPAADGPIAIQQQGLAAFFPREDIAPNACEFRGTITAIREGGDFLGTRFRLAEVTVFRSDDGEAEHQLAVAISDAVWDEPTGPDIGDDIVGVALLQATAIGVVR